MSMSIIVLAAGQGKRMKSALPKVLHPLAGRPLLEHVISTARQLAPQHIYVVYGHGGDQVRQRLAHLPVTWVEQAQQLGTGHAVAQAIPHIPSEHNVLILYGDVPLIDIHTLEPLVSDVDVNHLNLLTALLDDPSGYGRIVRDTQGAVISIVEQKDCDSTQRMIKEINTGIMTVSAQRLSTWLERLENNNAQGEFYLTDIIAMANADDVEVKAVTTPTIERVMGVNDRKQLATLERFYQRSLVDYYMEQGVSFADPARVDIRGSLNVGTDIYVDVNVVFEGNVVLGDHVKIGPNAVIRDAQIADYTEILSNCLIEGAIVGAHCRIGPYARLRPETRLHEQVHIGNFVEVKKSEIARGSKINHLSYIGDSEIGANVNVGAGTITCNYDGANKHRTIIHDNVFIGSGTQLVAPIIVGEGATIAAGSTLVKEVEAGGLTIGRVKPRHVPEWKRPQKKPK